MPRPAARLPLLVLFALLIAGCPKARALKALGGAELARVTDVRLSGEEVAGNVLVRWPGSTSALCIEALEWTASGDLSLTATPVEPCSSSSGPAEQWLAVRTTPATLGSLASATGPIPGSRSVLTASVDGAPVSARGSGRLGFDLADDFVVELGHSVGARSAKLEVRLSPPAVLVHVGLTNILTRDLRTSRSTWAVGVGDRTLRSGDLDAPATLPAGGEFDVVIELDPADALAIAGASVRGPAAWFRADLGLVSPWGKVILRSQFDL